MAETAVKKIKTLILSGPTAPKIEAAVRAAEGFDQCGMKIIHAENVADAVAIARENTAEGDIVILSPACASFDAFPNFAVRGDKYKDLVNKL